MSHPMYRLGAVWAFLAVSVAVALGDGEERLDLKVVGGPFQLNQREGVWGQWYLQVGNPSGRERPAKVACIADAASRGREDYTRIVSVPAACRREVEVAFRPGRLEKTDRKGQGGMGVEQSYVLWDPTTGRQIAMQTGLVIPIPREAVAVVVVNPKPIENDQHSYLKSLPGQVLGPVQIVTGSQRRLPTRWYGGSQADILVLGNLDVALLRPSQVRAILRWVRSGGCLLLSGSEATDALLRTELGEAAGVCAVGMHETDRFDICRPNGPSQTVQLGWPMPMVELCPLDAETIYEANGLPLLTRRRLGQGNVLTLATPMAVARPTPTLNLWSEVNRIRHERTAIDDGLFVDKGQETLRRIAGRRGPSKLLPVTVIAALLGLTVVSGGLLRLVRKGEWVWIILVPLGIAAGTGLFVYGEHMGDPERLSHIGLITGLGKGEARIRQLLAYYSGPEGRTVELYGGSPEALVNDIGRAAGTMRTSETRTSADGTAMPNLRVQKGDTRGFYTEAVQSLPSLDVQATFDADGLIGQIHNGLGQDIRDAVLLVNRRTYAVGDISTGGQTPLRVDRRRLLGRVEFPLPELSARPPLTRRSSGRRTEAVSQPRTVRQAPAVGEFSSAVVPDPLQTDLVRELITRPGTLFVHQDPVLIGYTSFTGLDSLPGRSLQHQGWSVVAWPVRLESPPPGSVVQIPPGLVDLTVRSNIWDVRNGRFIPSSRATNMALFAAPPAPLTALKNAQADIFVDLRAGEYRLTVYGARPTGPANLDEAHAVEIRSFANPMGRVEATIPHADQFMDVEGRVGLLLKVERIASPERSRRGATASDMLTWNLLSVDVALKGTVR